MRGTLMALEDMGGIILPGGGFSDDPQKLAAASVWFMDTSPSQRCSDGRQLHRVHRYQLVKTSDHDYCGSRPSSAYR